LTGRARHFYNAGAQQFFPALLVVNLELVPRSRHAERRLEPGDEVEVVTLVGGG